MIASLLVERNSNFSLASFILNSKTLIPSPHYLRSPSEHLHVFPPQLKHPTLQYMCAVMCLHRVLSLSAKKKPLCDKRIVEL